MTKTEVICSKGPNNFAMTPRIAMIELVGHEFTLYANLLDLAHPKTNKAQLSNKRLASRVGCTVKTLKKHRSRLCELGYIRLFYRDHYGQLVAIDDTADTETWDAIIIEIIDIWDANCQFTEAYKNKYDDKLAVLKNFLPTPQANLEEGDQKLQGDELEDDKENDIVTPIQISVGGVNNLQGSMNIIHPVSEEKTVGGSVKFTPNIINKELLKENKKKLEKNTLRDERGDFLLDDIFADTVEQSENNYIPESETSELPQLETQQGDTPYTVEELDYYKDLISLETLETHVYNPSHNVTQPRDSFRKPLKTVSDWQQLVAVVEHFFSVSSTGYATKIAQQIAGKAKSGLRHDFACSPPMNAVEACAFAYWLREAEELERLPEKAERIQERAMQFRALSNHFEHVNFARYILSDLLASHDPQEQLDPNSDLFKPAPKDVQDKAYAEAEALLGFSLSGEF